MIGLISLVEEKKLLKKIVEYYGNIYPEIKLEVREETLLKDEVGELHCCFPGVEEVASSPVKLRAIASALNQGYSTPLIVLRKESENKSILLDGIARALVAWQHGIPWKAFLIMPDKEIEFGVEKTIEKEAMIYLL